MLAEENITFETLVSEQQMEPKLLNVTPWAYSCKLAENIQVTHMVMSNSVQHTNWVYLDVKAFPVVQRVAQSGSIQLDCLAAGVALAEDVIKQDHVLNSACNNPCNIHLSATSPFATCPIRQCNNTEAQPHDALDCHVTVLHGSRHLSNSLGSLSKAKTYIGTAQCGCVSVYYRRAS